MLRLFLLLLLPCSLLGSLACAPADERPPAAPARLGQDPETLARRFYRALRTDDPEELAALLSERGLEGLRSGVGFRVDGETFRGWRVKRSRIEGAEAFVAVRTKIQGELQEIDLHFSWSVTRECWLIDGLRLFLEEIGELPIDFEDVGRYVRNAPEEQGPAEDETGATAEEIAWREAEAARREQTVEEERARFDSLAPTSVRKHTYHWTINLFGRARTARELIEEILAGTGIVLDEGEGASFLGRRVELELRDVSRIEALERIAAEVGLVPIYPPSEEELEAGAPDVPVLSFALGSHPYEPFFAGPMMVRIEDLQEHVPLATGTLVLGVYSIGIAPSVQAFQDRLYDHIVLERVLGPGGRELRADPDARFLGRPSTRAGFWGERVTLELVGLLRSVRKLARLEGRVRLRLPRHVEEHRFSRDPREGVTTREGQLLEVLEWGQTSLLRLRGPAQGVSSTELRLSPLGARANPIEVLFADSYSVGEELTASLQTLETPERLDVKVCSVVELDYPFSIQGIVLARSEDMPERLAELEFEGELPLLASFVGFEDGRDGLPGLRVRLQNTSNKDVTRISTEAIYLDARGRMIGAFPFLWEPGEELTPEERGAGLAPRLVVARGMTLSESRPALFMPEDTAGVRIEVREVEFADATRWPKR